jgi:hypothetical protein
MTEGWSEVKVDNAENFRCLTVVRQNQAHFAVLNRFNRKSTTGMNLRQKTANWPLDWMWRDILHLGQYPANTAFARMADGLGKDCAGRQRRLRNYNCFTTTGAEPIETISTINDPPAQPVRSAAASGSAGIPSTLLSRRTSGGGGGGVQGGGGKRGLDAERGSKGP